MLSRWVAPSVRKVRSWGVDGGDWDCWEEEEKEEEAVGGRGNSRGCLVGEEGVKVEGMAEAEGGVMISGGEEEVGVEERGRCMGGLDGEKGKGKGLGFARELRRSTTGRTEGSDVEGSAGAGGWVGGSSAVEGGRWWAG